MRKNLLQPEVRDEIIARINKLNAQTQHQWGKMNVNQGLRHMHDGLLMAYGDITSPVRPGWFREKLMRYFILNTDFPTPKEKAETFPEINMVENGINPPDFEAEKKTLIELVKNFPAKPTYHVSPLLGKMTTDNWGRLHYTHMHHHLLQFGV